MSIGTVMMKQAELLRENEVNDRPGSVSKRQLAGAAAATMIPGSQVLSACSQASLKDMFTQAQKFGVDLNVAYTPPGRLDKLRVGAKDSSTKSPILAVDLFSYMNSDATRLIARPLFWDEAIGKHSFDLPDIADCWDKSCPLLKAVYPGGKKMESPGDESIRAFHALVAQVLAENDKVASPKQKKEAATPAAGAATDATPTKVLRTRKPKDDNFSVKGEVTTANGTTSTSTQTIVTSSTNGTATSTQTIVTSTASPTFEGETSEKPSSFTQDVSKNEPANEPRVEKELTSPKQEEKAATSSTLSAGAATVATTANGSTASTQAIGTSAASHILERKVVEKPSSLNQDLVKDKPANEPRGSCSRLWRTFQKCLQCSR